MLDYTKKQVKIFFTVASIVIISGIIFVYFYYSRAIDVQMVAQTQTMATALESYYDRYHAYPTVSETEVSNIKLLSENGFNKEGKVIYFKSNFSWPRPVTLVSSGSNYLFKFSLKNSWPIWKIDNFFGGQCRLTNNVILNCGQQ